MEQSIVVWTIVGAASTGAATLIALLSYTSARRREKARRNREYIDIARTQAVAAVLLAISQYHEKHAKIASGRHWTDIAATYRSKMIESCVSAACAIPEHARLAASAPSRDLRARLRPLLESLLPDFALHRAYPEHEMRAQAGASTLAGVGMGTAVPGIGHVVGALIGSAVGFIAMGSTRRDWERTHRQNLETHSARCKEAVEKSLARLL